MVARYFMAALMYLFGLQLYGYQMRAFEVVREMVKLQLSDYRIPIKIEKTKKDLRFMYKTLLKAGLERSSRCKVCQEQFIRMFS